MPAVPSVLPVIRDDDLAIDAGLLVERQDTVHVAVRDIERC